MMFKNIFLIGKLGTSLKEGLISCKFVPKQHCILIQYNKRRRVFTLLTLVYKLSLGYFWNVGSLALFDVSKPESLC